MTAPAVPSGSLVYAGRQTVAVFIVDLAGRILLIQRDDRPGLLYAGHWGAVGGVVEPGETPETAALREVMEEAGLLLPSLCRLYTHAVPLPGGLAAVEHVFIARGDVREEHLVRGEGQALRFFGPREALALPLAFEHRRNIQRLIGSAVYQRPWTGP